VRILVVDDDYISRRIIIKTLSDFGHIDVFSTGAEAKEALNLAEEQKLPYDVLLIDGVLPDAYGWDIVKGIRKKETLRIIEKPLNIIVTSGFDDFQSISRKLDFIWMLKPINIKLLSEMIVNMKIESKAS
jgi:Response regulator containing CheY-like receiver domain and AraC-type DNA-binding domain